MGPLKQYATAIKVVLFGLFMFLCMYGAYDYGRSKEHNLRLADQSVYDQYKLDQQKHQTELLRKLSVYKDKQQEVTTKVVTKYIDRVVTVKEKGETLVREVPIYVSEVDDAGCTIPVGFGRLWNKANSTDLPVPESAGRADAAASWISELSAEAQKSGLSLSDVATQHIVESQYTLELEQRLSALQEWVREQRKLAETTQ